MKRLIAPLAAAFVFGILTAGCDSSQAPSTKPGEIPKEQQEKDDMMKKAGADYNKKAGKS